MPATVGLPGTGPPPHPLSPDMEPEPTAQKQQEEKPQGLSALRGQSRRASGRHTRAGGRREMLPSERQLLHVFNTWPSLGLHFEKKAKRER